MNRLNAETVGTKYVKPAPWIMRAELLFGLLDTNDDGILSPAELRGLLFWISLQFSPHSVHIQMTSTYYLRIPASNPLSNF